MQTAGQSYSALNWLNFFAADVATGVGPFLAVPFYPNLSFVTTAQILMGIDGAFYGPTLIALAACLVQKKDFDRTIGRNQTYNHAGNVASALLIGILGRYTDNEGVFYCLFALAIGCGLSVLAIRRRDLSHTSQLSPKPAPCTLPMPPCCRLSARRSAPEKKKMRPFICPPVWPRVCRHDIALVRNAGDLAG